MAASGSNPEAIQREIEATRRELAETVDAIAQKVSPKNVANRSADKVKVTAREQSQVLRARTEVLRDKAVERAGVLRERAGVASADLSNRLPASVTDKLPAAVVARLPAPGASRAPAEHLAASSTAAVNPDATTGEPNADSAVTLTPGAGYDRVPAWDPARKTVRWDRVALAGGAMTTLLLLLRRRRRRARAR